VCHNFVFFNFTKYTIQKYYLINIWRPLLHFRITIGPEILICLFYFELILIDVHCAQTYYVRRLLAHLSSSFNNLLFCCLFSISLFLNCVCYFKSNKKYFIVCAKASPPQDTNLLATLAHFTYCNSGCTIFAHICAKCYIHNV